MIYFWIGVAIFLWPVFDAAKKYGWSDLQQSLERWLFNLNLPQYFNLLRARQFGLAMIAFGCYLMFAVWGR